MRKRIALLIVLGFGPALAGRAETIPDRTLTIEDSVRLAMNNSPALLSSREDVNIAMQRVREAESLFFPKLDLNANWSKFRVEGDRPLLLQPAMGPTLIDDSPRQNFFSGRANIYQTVYEGGRSRNTWRQARISYERAKSVNDTLTAQVTGDAKQAFNDLLAAQEKLRQYQAIQQTIDSQSKVETGGLNLIRLVGEASVLKAQLAEARLAEQQARLMYLRTLNLELNTNVALKGQLETHPVELDLQKMLAWSTQYRAELRQTEYQQELDALGISLSLAERTPTVAFGASYERTGHDLDLPTANWAGTLNINLPVSISDMIFGWAKVREHRAQYRQATLKHAETADQIQMQVREAYTRYRFWQEELSPREQTLRRLEPVMESLRRQGVQGYERLIAERTFLEACLRYHEAIRGHLNALASLEQAVGHPLTSGF
ncbi:MAG: TolC family protein [Elusimicrobiota bacterium]|jgi:outer membrane protein TolC